MHSGGISEISDTPSARDPSIKQQLWGLELLGQPERDCGTNSRLNSEIVLDLPALNLN